MRLDIPPGATPLDPNEIEGLLPALSTQGELNDFEQRNIIEGRRWALGNRRFHGRLVTLEGLKELHRHMFDQIWAWAGRFRVREKNLCVSPEQIPEQVQRLCADAAYWIEHGVYDWRERAVIFHHRLVAIHPFPNGNGRHARLAADVMLVAHGEMPVIWGAATASDLGSTTASRAQYIDALRSADRHDYGPLLEFATLPERESQSDRSARGKKRR